MNSKNNQGVFMENPLSQGPSTAPDMKYCADCGKQIVRRAEICPHCGCRQFPPVPQNPLDTVGAKIRADYRAKEMVTLALWNLAWTGLGNVLAGDRKEGFAAMALGLLIIPVIFTTSPSFIVLWLALYVYCGVHGYRFLERKETDKNWSLSSRPGNSVEKRR